MLYFLEMEFIVSGTLQCFFMGDLFLTERSVQIAKPKIES